jgi:bacterioferritin-associated ferredoxin
VYVCICNAVTDREIRQCADLGVDTLDQLRECLGVASCCGRCEGTARAVLSEREQSATAGAARP